MIGPLWLYRNRPRAFALVKDLDLNEDCLQELLEKWGAEYAKLDPAEEPQLLEGEDSYGIDVGGGGPEQVA